MNADSAAYSVERSGQDSISWLVLFELAPLSRCLSVSVASLCFEKPRTNERCGRSSERFEYAIFL